MKRPYINDPETRHFFDRLDEMTWWESTIALAIGSVMILVGLVLLALGVKPKDD